MDKDWFEGRGVDEEVARFKREGRIFAGIVLGTLLGLLLLFFAQETFPDTTIPMHVYDKDGTTIRLMRGPCADPRVMEVIVSGMPQHAGRFKAIESTWRMKDGSRKDFAGCWIELTPAEVGFNALFLLFEDGDYYLVDKAKFLNDGTV